MKTKEKEVKFKMKLVKDEKLLSLFPDANENGSDILQVKPGDFLYRASSIFRVERIEREFLPEEIVKKIRDVRYTKPQTKEFAEKYAKNKNNYGGCRIYYKAVIRSNKPVLNGKTYSVLELNTDYYLGKYSERLSKLDLDILISNKTYSLSRLERSLDKTKSKISSLKTGIEHIKNLKNG